MIVTVMTSATGDMLATVADVKDALDLTDNAADKTLERFIGRASRRIARYLGRDLSLQKYQAVMPAYGGVNLLLPKYPVRSISRVFDGTDTGTATELSSTEYRLDADRGLLNRDEGWEWTYQTGRTISSEPLPGEEYKNWLVEFSAGYILPAGKDSGSTWDGTTATGPTLDADVQDACIEMVRNMWLSKDREPGVISEKVGDLSITYGPGESGIPESIKDILAPLRSLS